MERVILLGVPIDPVTSQEAVTRLSAMLEESTFHHVMTPNAEMLVASASDPAFRQLLNSTDLNLPDSAGLLHAARLTGQHLPERVTGVDTVHNLCASLGESHPVFLLGGREGVAEKAAAVLKARNPMLKVVGAYAGSPKPEDAADILRRINGSRPHLLLVAYGAPAQDAWIAAHAQEMPSVRVAMGVGGTFDFIVGTQVRAPRALQKMHLEWAWRLFQEPKRWKRILNAVVVFPSLVLRYRMSAPVP